DVVVMYLGEAAEIADVDTIFYNSAHPYTQALLRSIPRHDAKLDRLETIKGNVPDPTNIPKGCVFHPRCPHYVPAKCGNPPFMQVGEQHWARCARAFEINPNLAQTEQVS
ncbi:MAG TPA: oligopeptide/dipeptide ABC transporter ATP-binding protein, partial [Oceanobacillus sp.]|nr:oligopeptide/dipeptide ABC transporter ATP-binding protein [Oceanobacillus sp.]